MPAAPYWLPIVAPAPSRMGPDISPPTLGRAWMSCSTCAGVRGTSAPWPAPLRNEPAGTVARPVPPRTTPSVPAVAFDTSSAVTVSTTLPEPSKFDAAAVAPPAIEKLRAVASFVAVAALPTATAPAAVSRPFESTVNVGMEFAAP
ncbi:hypothetical protein D9M68_618700 [compost metagenome]